MFVFRCPVIEIMGSLKPDLVISDIQMPLMDGITFIRTIQLTSVPVIVATSSASSTDLHEIEARRQVFAAGAADFVIKPVSASDFIPRVKRFLG